MANEPDYSTPERLSQGKKPYGCVVVIFGASGDLTKRKLIPALYNLALEKRLPERFAVVGYARSEMTHEGFRDRMRDAVKEFSRTGLKDEAVWQAFANTLYYVRGGYDENDGFHNLKEFIDGFDRGSRVLPARVADPSAAAFAGRGRDELLSVNRTYVPSDFRHRKLASTSASRTSLHI